MKKITSLFLAVLMVATCFSGAVLTVSAANPLGFSIQSTTGGGAVSSGYQGAALEIGNEWAVTFDKNNFVWSASGDGTYNIGNCSSAWLIGGGAVMGQDVSVSGISLDGTTGNVIVTLKALRAYNGTFSLALNSGAGSTATYQTTLTVNQTISTITATQAGGSAPYSSSHSGTPVALTPGDKITFVIPANNFTWSSATGTKSAALTDTGWIKLSGASIGRDFNVAYGAPSANGDVTIVLTALRTASFNNLSIYLSNGVATTASQPVTVNIASTTNTGKIDGIASDARLGGNWSGALFNGKAISYNSLGSLSVQRDDELLLPLQAGFFTWDGTAPYSGSGVTTAQLRQGKIKVTASRRSGQQVFDSSSPEIISSNGLAYIKIKFIEPTTTTKDIDFGMTIYLTVNGRRDSGSGLEIYGTMERDVVEAGKDGSYYNLSDGMVLETDRYLRNVELYLGNGVTMYANLLSGKRYTGKAEMTISASDEEILRQYPAIDEIITLKTNNLDRSGNQVQLDRPGTNYYVYDANMKYLGRSNTKLPYSSKYYLSTKELDIKNNIQEPDMIPTPGILEPGLPVSSGKDTAPTNVNENPLTGW